MAPMIMELDSVAACTGPSFAKTSASDAIATEGADPKSPAKVAGLGIVPIRAKSDTMVPPSRNRAAISASISRPPSVTRRSRRPSLDVGFRGLLDGLAGGLRSLPSVDLDLLVRHRGCADEELLEFATHALRKVRELLVSQVLGRHRDDSIVSLTIGIPVPLREMPIGVLGMTAPGQVGASNSTIASIGSPSSARVLGMNPQS